MEWLTHPVTKEYLSVLDAEEAEIREKIGAGLLKDYSSDKVGMSYLENIGRADGVQMASRIEERFEDHDRIEEDEDEPQQD